ncbi:MAG: WecB/TagA/CpsF family glycosyltransferase [Patescibacteria group bacterium]|nr:WecB/TagA/CpsF family glycosyltransferase [Patescibacteria group bacterium]
MEILGVRVDNLSEEEILGRIESFLEDNIQRYIVTPNSEFLVRAQRDKKFMKILNKSDLAAPDSMGLVFASWYLGESLKKRFAGVDLMERICQRAVQKQWQILLIGGRKRIARKTKEVLEKKYPGLLVKRINMVEFDKYSTERRVILFVALGAPKQEKWIARNLRKNPSINLAIGVGGAFDFISGRVKRAPKFLRLVGMEWAWRLMVQPWRVKRVFNAIIVFPWLVVKNSWK